MGDLKRHRLLEISLDEKTESGCWYTFMESSQHEEIMNAIKRDKWEKRLLIVGITLVSVTAIATYGLSSSRQSAPTVSEAVSPRRRPVSIINL